MGVFLEDWSDKCYFKGRKGLNQEHIQSMIKRGHYYCLCLMGEASSRILIAWLVYGLKQKWRTSSLITSKMVSFNIIFKNDIMIGAEQDDH